jgi:hypothetical protein
MVLSTSVSNMYVELIIDLTTRLLLMDGTITQVLRTLYKFNFTLKISKAIPLFVVVPCIIYVVFTTLRWRLHHFNLHKQLKIDM